MYAVPFRDGLGGVQSRLEWSRCRRSDMGFGRGFQHACYLLPSGLKDSASKVLELYPAALRWRRSRRLLSYCDGEDRSWSTPHPEPEDERDDDENGIEGESLGEKHRSYRLAFDQMNSEV